MKNAVQLNKFDYRLANKLDTDLQKLRCRVNYHALKFADPISEMGKTLVRQMRMRSKHYIALHLRHVSLSLVLYIYHVYCIPMPAALCTGTPGLYIRGKHGPGGKFQS